jgi:TatD DNase family protein
MIDSHIHLDADQYADVAGLIKRAREAGVTAAVVPGTAPASNRRVMELAGEHPGFVHPAIGFHPERLELTEADVETTLALIRQRSKSICAVGEVGLPYYGDAARQPAVAARARALLARFAEAAAELDLPLILHCPHETASEALAIIRQAKARRAVFHWHKSDPATTQAIIEAGYFISITPEVVYRERDQALARMVPLSNLMVETDGPWPYRGPFEGRTTEPAMVADAVAAIASMKGVAVERVAEATTANAKSLFRI